jgi:hypothetical protein
MISKEWLLAELDSRATDNEKEGQRLEETRDFESARYYFGGAGALRELIRDLESGLSG